MSMPASTTVIAGEFATSLTPLTADERLLAMDERTPTGGEYTASMEKP